MYDLQIKISDEKYILEQFKYSGYGVLVLQRQPNIIIKQHKNRVIWGENGRCTGIAAASVLPLDINYNRLLLLLYCCTASVQVHMRRRHSGGQCTCKPIACTALLLPLLQYVPIRSYECTHCSAEAPEQRVECLVHI